MHVTRELLLISSVLRIRCDFENFSKAACLLCKHIMYLLSALNRFRKCRGMIKNGCNYCIIYVLPPCSPPLPTKKKKKRKTSQRVFNIMIVCVYNLYSVGVCSSDGGGYTYRKKKK